MNRPYFSRRALPALMLFAALACAAAFSPAGSGQDKGASFAQDVGRALGRYDRLALDPADAERRVRQTGRLTLETSAGAFELLLKPNDVRSENYRAVAVLENGETRELPREPSRTFEGAVAGLAGSHARFTLDGGTLEGLIIAGGEKFFVESAARYTRDAAPKDFLFYRESDVLNTDPAVCAVETLSTKVNSQLSRTQAEAAALPPLSPMRQAEIATEADFEFTQAFGGNPDAANAEIQSIMNQVNGVYQTEIGLTFRIVYQRAWNTPNDPFNATTLSGTLEELRNTWINSPPVPIEARDLVHLWIGKDLDGFQTGLAYSDVTINGVATRGVVCRVVPANPTTGRPAQDFAYGVSERQAIAPQKYVIPAHEIGHNFGASHPEQTGGPPECSLTIMSGTAQGNTAFTFCQFSRDEITNYVSAHGNCLAAVASTTPSVQFSANSYSVNEGMPSVQITVTRSSGDGVSTVEYRTADGSASERSDYTTAVGTLVFNAGETSKSFSVLITDDAFGTVPNESAVETFQVILSNQTGATLGTPNSASVTIISNEAAGNGASPVRPQSFNPEFFVRQHYHDFLNRDPDPQGLSHWMNQTTNCGDPNPEVCRVNVSAAFFLSIEFQETGFYAIRVQRVAFGRRSDTPSTRMTYREVIRDQRQVGAGVIVGQPGYQQVLEANKNAYAAQVAASGAFAARFPQTTAEAFVDALYSSAGVAPPAAERQNAINAYNNPGSVGAANSRAAALRAVADSNSVRGAELNTAFVLLQYHGYLRRNPTDPPNTDDSGYQFWLGKLNQFGGNYVAAEMVKAFISSDEYILRFGQ